MSRNVLTSFMSIGQVCINIAYVFRRGFSLEIYNSAAISKKCFNLNWSYFMRPPRLRSIGSYEALGEITPLFPPRGGPVPNTFNIRYKLIKSAKSLLTQYSKTHALHIPHLKL